MSFHCGSHLSTSLAVTATDGSFRKFWESSLDEVFFPVFHFVANLFTCLKARGAFIGFSAPAGAADVSWQDRFTKSI